MNSWNSSRDHSWIKKILDEIVYQRPLENENDELYQTSSSTCLNEVDVVISGGGLKGYFVTGASYVLHKSLSKNGITVARAAGTSAGAWAAFFLLIGLDISTWIETYYACQDMDHLTIHEAYDLIIPWIKAHIPENTYESCNHRLFISISEITIWGLKNCIVNEFQSNDDIFQALLGSSTIPFVSEKSGFRQYRNMWVADGKFQYSYFHFVTWQHILFD
jgi:predicted acylesterase/phospholipase RssA